MHEAGEWSGEGWAGGLDRRVDFVQESLSHCLAHYRVSPQENEAGKTGSCQGRSDGIVAFDAGTSR